jgi:uncharacterized protein (TIGR00297 family)
MADVKKTRSGISNAIALICAAALLLADLWRRGPELLHRGNRLYIALITTIAFAVAARIARGVNTSGALAGASVAFILASRDLRMFWILLIVFFITLAATRLGASRKRQLRVAEAKSGRSASQVIANLGIAALVLVIADFRYTCLPALAALAEVAADTTSSEIGTAFPGGTVLITTWKSVPSGTDGGISPIGTAAGLVAAVVTAACALGLGLIRIGPALVIACAATAGMLIDSLLGALLERRGYLNNDLVNFLSTLSAALISWAVGS